MSKVMLAKYFERWEENDFSDDGTYFRCYKLVVDGKEYQLSYTKGQYGIFLSAHHICDNIDHVLCSLDESYYKLFLDASKVANRFNTGCLDITSDELAIWKEDLIAAVRRINAFTIPKPTVYFNELDNKYYGYVYERRSSYSDVIERNLKVIYVDTMHPERYVIKHLKIVD